MIYVVIDQSQTHQNELMFSLISKQMVTYGNICRCVNTQVSIQTYISLFCQLGVPEKQGHILAMSTPSIQVWVLTPFSNQTDDGSMEKWLTGGPGRKFTS